MVGGSALGIGVTMFLRDQFSGPAARVRGAAQMTAQEIRRMQEQQLRQQRNMYAGMALAGGLALRRMGKVVNSAADFGFEMEFVKQISKSSGQEMSNLSGQAMALGQRTIFFAKDVAEGMRFMAMAGMGYKDVAGNIGAAVDLAAAANLSIAGRGGAADIMTNIMKAFKKEAHESSYVADILAEAATNANTNVFELGESLKYAGSTAMDLNIPLEEISAMAMTLANAGMQGSMAGVAMENSMRYLARSISQFASGTQKKALAQTGLTAADFQDANGNLLPMVDNIGKLRKALQGVGNVQKQAILQTLFGVRGKRAGSLLIRNYEEFVGHLGIFQDAHGRAAEISSGMMDTLKGSILRLQAVWKHMGIIFTRGIEPILRPLLFVLEKGVNVLQKLFDIPVLGNFLASGIAGFIAIKTVAFAFKAIMAGIRLITLQTTGAMATMQARGVAGWNAMTASARRYGAAATAAGMAGKGRMGGVVGRNIVGSLYRTSTGRTGKAGQLIGGAVGARYMARFGARAAAGAGARVAGGAATRVLLGRVVGILGGPLGLALSFVLPAAIGALVSAVKKNKEATERGTEVLKAQNKQIMMDQRFSRMGHIIEFQDIHAPAIKVIGETGVGKVGANLGRDQLKRLADNLETLLNTPSSQTIVINVDNEEAVTKILERNQKDAFQMFQ